MKKLGILLAIFALFAGVSMVSAATDTEYIDVNLDIDSTLTLTCDDTVDMGTITGTGQSALATNSALCTVITNNSAGYQLEWSASTTAYMENANSDQIAAYTPASAGVPETWSVAAADSEWGARVRADSTDPDDGSLNWGAADTYAGGNWLNVSTTPTVVASRATETAQAGSSEYIQFGAEVGASHWQPTGTYDIEVVMTATTL